MTTNRDIYAWANPDKSIAVRATDGKTPEFTIDIQTAKKLKDDLHNAIRAATEIQPSTGVPKQTS
jgi:hypothetical protein